MSRHRKGQHRSAATEPGYVVAIEGETAGTASPKPQSPEPEHRVVKRGTEVAGMGEGGASTS